MSRRKRGKDMSQVFPSGGIAKKFKRTRSNDDTALVDTITVGAEDYGVVYRLWLSIDISSEADLELLPALLTPGIVIGSLVFDPYLHPFVEHRNASEAFIRTVDLGPWFFDFGLDGLYSGVKGDDIVITIPALGSGIKSKIIYLYSGD